MLSDITTVIFDVDGTIADSMWVWSDIDRQFFKDYGIKHPEGFEKEIEGKGFSELAHYFKDRFGLKESPWQIMAMWTEMAKDRYAHTVRLKPGFYDLFQHLKKHGYRIGIATSNSYELVSILLRAHGLNGCIDALTSGNEVPVGKPSPEIYLLTAKKLLADPKDCLVFEDISNGILSAKRAGMRVCAVDDPYSKEFEDEKRFLADYYIVHFDQVLEGSYEVLS